MQVLKSLLIFVVESGSRTRHKWAEAGFLLYSTTEVPGTATSMLKALKAHSVSVLESLCLERHAEVAPFDRGMSNMSSHVLFSSSSNSGLLQNLAS